MIPTKPLLERAYELARSGQCAGLLDIRARLKAEGYSAQGQLTGLGLKRQLKRICQEASVGASPTEPVG